MATMTHAEAVSPAVAALNVCDALGDAYAAHTGTDRRPVVRPDLVGGVGMVITYASTADYMLESRASGDGRFAHRVNLDHYASAADIPATYRKAKAIAARVESANAAELIEAKRAYGAAYAAYRATGL